MGTMSLSATALTYKWKRTSHDDFTLRKFLKVRLLISPCQAWLIRSGGTSAYVFSHREIAFYLVKPLLQEYWKLNIQCGLQGFLSD